MKDFVNGIGKLLSLPNINKLPRWAVVGAAGVAGLLALREVNRQFGSPIDLDGGDWLE